MFIPLKKWHLIPGERVEIFDLKGERISQAKLESLEEIFRRVQFVMLDFEYSFLDDEVIKRFLALFEDTKSGMIKCLFSQIFSYLNLLNLKLKVNFV